MIVHALFRHVETSITRFAHVHTRTLFLLEIQPLTVKQNFRLKFPFAAMIINHTNWRQRVFVNPFARFILSFSRIFGKDKSEYISPRNNFKLKLYFTGEISTKSSKITNELLPSLSSFFLSPFPSQLTINFADEEEWRNTANLPPLSPTRRAERPLFNYRVATRVSGQSVPGFNEIANFTCAPRTMECSLCDETRELRVFRLQATAEDRYGRD